VSTKLQIKCRPIEFIKFAAMQKILLYSFLILSTLVACDNEVDLNADYEDTTVVYGLLNANEDTQFVKVNRAFLEDGVSAIELAKQSDRFFYDSLDVRIVQGGGNNPNVIDLLPIAKKKDPGVFANDRNIVFYTTDSIIPNLNHRLEVTQPDGKITRATTSVLTPTQIVRPEVDRNNPPQLRLISLHRILPSGLEFLDYEFIIRFTPVIAEVQLNVYLLYDEVSGSNRIPKRVRIPVGGIRNTELQNDDQILILPGDFFYNSIADQLEGDNSVKEINPNRNLLIEVIAVDPLFSQYTSVYGPLDGLAQVRPEYTNVENGIGLFASRSTRRGFSALAQISYQQLLNGPITGGLNFR